MTAFAALVLTGGEPLAAWLNEGLTDAGAEVVIKPGEHLGAGWEPAVGVLVDPARIDDPLELRRAVHLLLESLPDGGYAVLTRRVTDTLKVVDDAGTVLGTADREHHRALTGPLAGPFETVHGLLRRAHDLGDAVTALLSDGIRVRTVLR